MQLERLIEGEGYNGYTADKKSAGRETEIETAQARTVSGGGLAPLPTSTSSRVSPALETPPQRRGPTSLSFRATGGKVELVLRVKKDGVMPRFTSLLAALVIATVFGFRAWKKRS